MRGKPAEQPGRGDGRDRAHEARPDRRPERRIGRRPVALIAAILTVISMGVLTWKGATAKEALGSELIASGTVDEWAEVQGFADDEAAVAGATLFAQSGCLNCHT